MKTGKETRGRKKGETYSRKKPLYEVFVNESDNPEIDNFVNIGRFCSYLEIGNSLNISRNIVQNIYLGRQKKLSKKIKIKRL